MKLNMLNKSLVFILSTALVSASISSCKKGLSDPTSDATEEAYVSVHRFTLLAGTSDSVFVNNNKLSLGGSAVALAANGSLLGNFIGVNPGSVSVALRATAAATNYVSRTVNVSNATATSFFGYDTLTAAGTARMLVLKTDMTAAPAGTSNVRLLHLSPNAGNVNITLARTANQYSLAVADTVRLTNVPYIGASANPDETALSAYRNIPAGTYALTIVSGTTTLVNNVAVTFREGKNYSLVARGFTSARASIPTGQTFGATLLLHNP